MDAEKIMLKSMKIAGDFCVYTNHNLTVESLGVTSGTAESSKADVIVEAPKSAVVTSTSETK